MLGGLEHGAVVGGYIAADAQAVGWVGVRSKETGQVDVHLLLVTSSSLGTSRAARVDSRQRSMNWLLGSAGRAAPAVMGT